MDIFNTYATDETLEVEGAWQELSKTAKVRVARAGNERYVAVLRKKIEASGLDLTDGKKETDAAVEKLVIESMAEAILVGWEGLTFKGVPLAYNAANSLTLLQVKDFRKKISAYSEKFEAFRAKAEEAQGNG